MARVVPGCCPNTNFHICSMVRERNAPIVFMMECTHNFGVTDRIEQHFYVNRNHMLDCSLNLFHFVQSPVGDNGLGVATEP